MSVAAVLGGALQGVGIGMMQQTKQRDEERRDAALAALRRQENAENNAMVADREAQGDKRRSASQMALQDDHQTFTAEQGTAAAKAQDARDTKKRQWDVEDRDHKERFETQQAALDRAAKVEIELGKPIDTVTNEINGDRTIIFRDPKSANGIRQIVVPKAAEQQPRASTANSSLFAEPVQPVTAGKPAAPARPDFVWDPKTSKLVPNTAKGS